MRGLTSCRMVSVKTLCQSVMMLSVSYCIRNSTPFLLFNWRGDNEIQLILGGKIIAWITHLDPVNNKQQTSKTFFLLDLSFEAQPIVAPRRSTVNSGTIWLVLFCTGKEEEAVYETHGVAFRKKPNKSCNCPCQLMTWGLLCAVAPHKGDTTTGFMFHFLY